MTGITLNIPTPTDCEACGLPIDGYKCPDDKWKCVECCDHPEHGEG